MVKSSFSSQSPKLETPLPSPPTPANPTGCIRPPSLLQSALAGNWLPLSYCASPELCRWISWPFVRMCMWNSSARRPGREQRHSPCPEAELSNRRVGNPAWGDLGPPPPGLISSGESSLVCLLPRAGQTISFSQHMALGTTIDTNLCCLQFQQSCIK